MKCFRHPAADAVGVCKHCSKGVCGECARETAGALVCSSACEEEVKSLRAMVERNRKVVPIAAPTHLRSAILLFAMAVIFLGFGMAGGRGYFSWYLIAFGVVMLLGGTFALFNSRRIARL